MSRQGWLRKKPDADGAAAPRRSWGVGYRCDDDELHLIET